GVPVRRRRSPRRSARPLRLRSVPQGTCGSRRPRRDRNTDHRRLDRARLRWPRHRMNAPTPRPRYAATVSGSCLALGGMAAEVDLARTHPGSSRPGRPFVVRALWLIVEALFLLYPVVTSYRLKTRLLRMFGATIGEGLLIKPGVHVKYPWRLR